jgi:FkbM family methyltransferase
MKISFLRRSIRGPTSSLMQIANVAGHSFVQDPIANAETIIDAGANQGEFSHWVNASSGATVYAFEPDPRCFEKLPAGPKMIALPWALDGVTGSLTFFLGKNRCSSAIYQEAADQQRLEVKRITLQDFCAERRIGHIDLLKLDIEGAELSVLELIDAGTLGLIDQITVEFHDFINPGDTVRIKSICQRLTAAGFYLIRFSHYAWSDCLFINRAKLPLPFADRLKFSLYNKWYAGVVRHLRARWNRRSHPAPGR